MSRPTLLIALLVLAAVSSAEAPWPMERHDRWGSGTAKIGPSSASLTKPWGFARLSNTVPVTHGPAIVSKTLGYYGDWINNKVYKFNPSTGQVYLSFQSDSFVQSTPAVGADGQVFFSTNNVARLLALNPATMDYNWFVNTGSGPIDDFHSASPTIGPDGDIVMPSTNGSVFRVHPNGTSTWTKTGLGSAYRTIVFSRDDTKIFVANGNSMTALYYSTGLVAWSKDYGSPVGSPGVAPGGALFFGTKAGNIYRLDPNTGDTVWTKALLGEVHYAPCFTPGGGTAYFVANDGRLYAYRVSDGNKNWSYSQSAYPITNAPIAGTDGRVYLFNRVGDLDSVSASGQQIWHVHMPHDGYGRGTMTYGPDGSLYVGFVSDITTDAGLAIIRQQPIQHTFSTVSRDQGATVGGSRTDTFYTDNVYLVGAPTSTTTPKVRYTFTRTFPLSGQAQLWAWIESSATADGIQQTSELYDWTTAAWVQIDQRLIATTDKTHYIRAPDNFAKFVQAGTGTVRFRFTFAPTVNGLGTSWQVKIDKATIGNVPTFSIPA